MSEGRVTNHGNGWEYACIGCTLGHGDGGSHVHTTVDGTERRQGTQGIATDISKDTGSFVFCRYLVQCIVYITMTAPLTKCRRTGHHILGIGIGLFDVHAKGCSYTVRSKLTHARQIARQTALQRIVGSQEGFHLFFHEWLTVFGNEQRIALSGQGLDGCFRQWILGYFQNGDTQLLRIVFHYIIVGDTTSDDSKF